MPEPDIDQQVADLIDALQGNETHAIADEKLPDNDFFFGMSEENHEQLVGHEVGSWRIKKLLEIGGMSVGYQVLRLSEGQTRPVIFMTGWASTAPLQSPLWLIKPMFFLPDNTYSILRKIKFA